MINLFQEIRSKDIDELKLEEERNNNANAKFNLQLKNQKIDTVSE